MKTKSKIYQVKDNAVDLSRIKTIKLAIRYSGDKDKKKIVIEYNARIEYLFSSFSQENELQTITDTVEILFDNEAAATNALELLKENWEEYLSE